MKNFIKIFLVIILFALISVGCYFIFKLCGFSNISQIKEWILNSKKYSVIIYILLFSLSLILLCFVPLLNTSFVILGITIFGPLTTFISCMICNIISSTVLFFIGDKFGESVARKLVGKKDFERVQNLIDNKSKILLPILYIIPFFPDECLCLVAGMTKMKYWYLILISILYHSLEFGMFCFLGSDIINWSELSIIDWFVLINIVLIDIKFLLNIEKNIKNRKKD